MSADGNAGAASAADDLAERDLATARHLYGEFGRTGLIVVAIVLYGLLRLPYSLFYGLLGSSPEEVRLGYVELLSQSVVALMVPVLLLVYVALALAFVRVLAKLAARGDARERALEWVQSIWEWRYRAAAIAFGLYLLLALPAIAVIEAAEARNGNASLVTRFGLLGLRADPVTVEWLSPEPAPPDLDSDTLMFLGRNTEQVVLYDYETGSVVRVPVADVVLVTDA